MKSGEAQPRPLDCLREGESGQVAYLESPESERAQRLLAMGLAPGAAVRVDQRFPSIVVAVEENVIAMETSVAREIFVLVDGVGASRRR